MEGRRLIKREFVHPHFSEVEIYIMNADGWTGKAVDTRTRTKVAMKARFELNEKANIAVTVLRDIGYMTDLNHKNVMKVIDVIGSNRAKSLLQIYFTMELMHYTLRDYVSNHPGPLDPSRIRNWMSQIALGLNYIHSAYLIHRDIKPENILVSESLLEVKITDFDLARVIGPEVHNDYTEKVGTTVIMAPEVLAGNKRYSCAVDIWALGCVFYFMIRRDMLFANVDEKDMLQEIVSKIGTPTKQDLRKIDSRTVVAQIKAFPPHPIIDWRARLPPIADDSAVALIQGMFKFCELDRITMGDILAHDYFAPERATEGYKEDIYHGRPLTHYRELTCSRLKSYLRRRITLDRPVNPAGH